MNTAVAEVDMSPRRSRRPSTVVVGAALVVVAGVVGVALPIAAEARRDAAVAALARVPAGCVSTLDVRRAGQYLVYVETRGRLDAVPGSCTADTSPYDLAAPPRVRIGIEDADGEPVTLERTTGPAYDTDDHAGVAVRRVEFLEAGPYVVDVTSTEPRAVVAIGADVSDVGRTLRVVGLVSGALGVLVGLAVVIRGVASPSRRDRTR